MPYEVRSPGEADPRPYRCEPTRNPGSEDWDIFSCERRIATVNDGACNAEANARMLAGAADMLQALIWCKECVTNWQQRELNREQMELAMHQIKTFCEYGIEKAGGSRCP